MELLPEELTIALSAFFRKILRYRQAFHVAAKILRLREESKSEGKHLRGAKMNG